MPIHLVLRVPLMTRVDRRSFSTIDAHNEVAEATGRVALAKFGNPGTASRVEKLKAQIEEGIQTLLILVVKRDDKFLGYQAPLSTVHHGQPGELATLAPAYYAKLGETPRLWFVVNSPFLRSELAGLRLATNHRPLVAVMSECRTATMLVEPRP
jgi:hypothetical protein